MAPLSLFTIAALLVFVKHQHLVNGLDNNRVYNCYDEFCNQHSHTCSQKTTFCRNCQDNTIGRYCDICKYGYYGNATASKNGCKRCPCPYVKSRGGLCEHNKTTNTFKCLNCMSGYHGQLCDQCDKGYYKTLKTGLCLPCNCNGHGNASLEQQCEPMGGRCFQCFHQTKGIQCEKCIDGYYLQVKNSTKECVRCDCSGNAQAEFAPICDWKSGICIQCSYNTTGVNCEKCAQGYWGDAVVAKNCTRKSPGVVVQSPVKPKHVIIALVTSLAIIVASLIALSIFIWWKRRKARDPLGFVTINMNHADEDDYNISWIDPVTGDPIRHNEVDTEMPLVNGNLELIDDAHDDHDEYHGHGGELESRDTDRML